MNRMERGWKEYPLEGWKGVYQREGWWKEGWKERPGENRQDMVQGIQLENRREHQRKGKQKEDWKR